MVRTETSGSTGEPTRLSSSFRFLEKRALTRLFRNSLFGDEERPRGQWRAAGQSASLSKSETTSEKRFTTNRFRWSAEGVRSLILGNVTIAISYLSGRPVHRPQFVPRDQPLPVVKWLAANVARGTPALLACASSLAIRVCAYAKEHGFDLSGTLFEVGGEPFTEAKAAVLESVGAAARVHYTMRESNGVGRSCAAPNELDEVHLLSDTLALIQREKVTSSGAVVPAVVLTGLFPDFPKVMLNIESGDYARVFERDCGCPFEAIGYTTHLSQIRSYEKLTSDGVTFLGTLLYDLVETVLPARFGGTIGDYQLAEEEDESGVRRVSIVVAPDLGEVEEAAVVETVLENLRSSHELGGELMADQWRQAGTLRVVRREPFQTNTMKVPPLYSPHAAVAAVEPQSDTR